MPTLSDQQGQRAQHKCCYRSCSLSSFSLSLLFHPRSLHDSKFEISTALRGAAPSSEMRRLTWRCRQFFSLTAMNPSLSPSLLQQTAYRARVSLAHALFRLLFLFLCSSRSCSHGV